VHAARANVHSVAAQAGSTTFEFFCVPAAVGASMHHQAADRHLQAFAHQQI
jgi:hypothetical protein